jgi:hypothetical protein
MTKPLRYMCRRCRSKLAEPVANEHLAFCTPGCFSSFYRKRCRVCEEPIHLAERRRGPKRVLCHKAKCRAEYRQYPHLYHGPVGISSKEPILLAKTESGPEGSHPLQPS